LAKDQQREDLTTLSLEKEILSNKFHPKTLEENAKVVFISFSEKRFWRESGQKGAGDLRHPTGL
jgi:hypothetical protein